MRAVTSAMADALASRSCLPGPAVTRDMRQEGGEGECRDRRSFWQLLQEYSLIVSLPIGKLPSVNSLVVPAHVVIDLPETSFPSGSAWRLCLLYQPQKHGILKALDRSQGARPTFAQACIGAST